MAMILMVFPACFPHGWRHDFGVHVGDAKAHGHGFGTAVHADELVKRTPATGVSEFLTQAFIEPFLENDAVMTLAITQLSAMTGSLGRGRGLLRACRIRRCREQRRRAR